MAYNNEPQGYIKLFESDPDKGTVLFGSLNIPMELIQAAIDAGDVYESQTAGEMVSLNVSLWEFDPEHPSNADDAAKDRPPVFKGYINKIFKKQGGGKKTFAKKTTTTGRRRFS